MKSIIPYLVSFAVGFVAASGWYQFHGPAEYSATIEKPMRDLQRSAESSLTTAPDQSGRAGQGQPCRPEVSLEAIRNIVQEEIKLVGRNCANNLIENNNRAETVTSEDAETLDNVTVEQTEAFDDSLAVIEESRSVGVWDSTMRDQFRDHLMKVNPGQQEELILSVIKAINSGEIVPEADLMPFLW